jgi:ketosteroid isomerase-like protein
MWGMPDRRMERLRLTHRDVGNADRRTERLRSHSIGQQPGATMQSIFRSLAAASLAFAAVSISLASPPDDKAAVAALDTQYQAAVKANDAATMDRILADDFVLVTGKGKSYNKADLLKSARDKTETYEHQEDTDQTVRVWGDTAVVTALLWIKGSNKDGAYEYKLWFSDTYARTKSGWRYVFGQASSRLEK